MDPLGPCGWVGTHVFGYYEVLHIKVQLLRLRNPCRNTVPPLQWCSAGFEPGNSCMRVRRLSSKLSLTPDGRAVFRENVMPQITVMFHFAAEGVIFPPKYVMMTACSCYTYDGRSMAHKPRPKAVKLT